MSDNKSPAGKPSAASKGATGKPAAAKPVGKPAGKPAGQPARKSGGMVASAGRAGTGKSVAAPKAVPPADPHNVLLHPMVTEKTMMLMDRNNSLEFLVRREANKPQVKAAIERLFDCKVATVNTRITKDGKRAVVKFAGDTTAEDIGMRIGVF
jgi:large subunit ribosomal protein L23